MRSRCAGQTVCFGDSEFELSLPRGKCVGRVEPRCPTPRAPAAEVARSALENPVGSLRLREVAQGKRSAAVLVPGKDRVAGVRACLPLLLEELHEAGVKDEQVEVFLATGTHAKHTAAEVAALLGEEVFSRVRWREHDCSDDSQLKPVGATKYGTEVQLHRGVVDADLRVLVGRIIPHYFAGFGGGRKALIPGVAGYRTILQNHRLTLLPRRGIHPRVRPCSLKGNPVHLDMLEGARLAGGVFVLDTLLDAAHNVIGAFAGGLETAHEAGCAEAREMFRVEMKEPVDAVITSAGGSPYDCNFTQALKALFDVQEAVRPAGAILWIAQCAQGMKREFLRWAQVESREELEDLVRQDYDLGGHNTLMLRELCARVRVALWSALPDQEVRAVGVEPVHSLAEGVDWLLETLPRRFRYAVVPFGNVTYATVA